jgi:hypothetical protein
MSSLRCGLRFLSTTVVCAARVAGPPTMVKKSVYAVRLCCLCIPACLHKHLTARRRLNRCRFCCRLRLAASRACTRAGTSVGDRWKDFLGIASRALGQSQRPAATCRMRGSTPQHCTS